MTNRLVLILVYSFFSLPAHAYIGPGVGAGAIAVVLGFLAAIGMAFVAIFWYPVKRLLKSRKAKTEAVIDDETADR